PKRWTPRWRTRPPTSKARRRRRSFSWASLLVDGLAGTAAPAYQLRPKFESSIDVGVVVRLGGPIAHPAQGLDEAFVLGAELGSEPADVDVHRSRAPIEVVPPHLVQQGAPGEHPAGSLDQEPEQLELLVRE